jgi:hypothetical protein
MHPVEEEEEEEEEDEEALEFEPAPPAQLLPLAS